MDIRKFVLSYYTNATESLHINEITKPKGALSLHCHDYYQIYYLKSGRVIHHLERGSAELKPGDVFIIPPNLPHYIETASSTVRFYSISFKADYIEPVLRGNRLVADFIHGVSELTPDGIEPSITLRAEDIAIADSLVIKMMDEFSSDRTGKDELIKASLSLLLSLFARAYLDERVHSVSFVTEREEILHLLGYIKNHLGDPMSLDTMAQRTAMSKSVFCEAFQRVTGESFKRYLNRVRVEAAAVMIKSGERVTNAAMMVGYNDFSTFYRNFKARFGVSPRGYK